MITIRIRGARKVKAERKPYLFFVVFIFFLFQHQLLYPRIIIYFEEKKRRRRREKLGPRVIIQIYSFWFFLSPAERCKPKHRITVIILFVFYSIANARRTDRRRRASRNCGKKKKIPFLIIMKKKKKPSTSGVRSNSHGTQRQNANGDDVGEAKTQLVRSLSRRTS